MIKLIWEMCLELGIVFGQDIVFNCFPEMDEHKRAQVGFNVQHITEPQYSRLSWTDDDVLRRPAALVADAVRRWPQARLFLLDQRGKGLPADDLHSQQRGVLTKLLEDPVVRQRLLQEPRMRLCIGTIYQNELTLAPPEEVETMLRSFR